MQPALTVLAGHGRPNARIVALCFHDQRARLVIPDGNFNFPGQLRFPAHLVAVNDPAVVAEGPARPVISAGQFHKGPRLVGRFPLQGRGKDIGVALNTLSHT
ncbi:MAG: hypothetical protein BWY09_01190 [Candidatus Hydrogenedentes bacterium ADurb.Bin179]|nr:MAG: hypothetical protein BWY09_01190 [Candidatus Hydrogenedentes bacterium ADurb.Bin179]